MDELVKLVAQRTGIAEDTARTAVDTVVGYLKERLPEPIAGHVDSVLSGQAPGGGMDGIAGKLGGIFGGGSTEG